MVEVTHMFLQCVETDHVDTAVLLAAIQPAQASAKDGDTPLDVPTTTGLSEAPSMEERQRDVLILSWPQ